MHGAVLGPEAFALRFFGPDADDRLLIVNLGRNLEFSPPSEPLLAPPSDRSWRVLWNSEEPKYGGVGLGEPQAKEGWCLPGHAAFVCAPQ